MMKRKWKRTLSVVLSLAMIVSMTGISTVFALEGTPPGASSLCDHHTEHTAGCGYTEGTPETPCGHEHTDECYKEVEKCVHEHTEDCYDDSEEIASDNDAREPINCSHICDEDSGCITEVLDCQHEHDDACGYVAAVTGSPCTFVCEECKKLDSGAQAPPMGDSGGSRQDEPEEEENGPYSVTVTGFDGLDTAVARQVVKSGATTADLTLPATLGASGYTVADDTEPAPLTIEGVTWESDSPFDGDTAEEGLTVFTPVLPAGYTCAGGVELPLIRVQRGNPWLRSGDTYNSDDVAAFKTILAAHPSLKSIDGVEENVPASWETAGLVTWGDSSPKRITMLNLNGTGLTGTLDVTSLTALTTLRCFDNELTELTGVSGLSALKALDCSNNQLKALDVSRTALTHLNCSTNELTELTGVSGLSALKALNCSTNQLTSLDVTDLTVLTDLYCSNNQLTALDVTGTALTYLVCSNNLLTSLTGVSDLSALKVLNCSTNQLEALDVTGRTALTTLDCSNNQLKALDVSRTALTDLYCSNNPLTSFTAPDGKTLTIVSGSGGKVIFGSNDPNDLANKGYVLGTKQVTLTAVPDSGKAFDKWTGAATGAENPVVFPLSETGTVTANFKTDDSSTLDVATGLLTIKDTTDVTDKYDTEGWKWENSVLTLKDPNGSSSGDPVNAVKFSDNLSAVKLTLASNVTLAPTTGSSIRFESISSDSGTLTIDPAGYTLTATPQGNYNSIQFLGDDLDITGSGTVSASSQGAGGIAVWGGNLTISGAASVTAKAASNHAISADNITISTSGTVTTTSSGTGSALFAKGAISITGGTVTAKSTGDDPAMYPAPDVSGYPGGAMITASMNAIGTPTTAYDAADIADYKYLKVEKATAPRVTGVTVSPREIEVQKNTTQQFAATVTGSNLTDGDKNVTWAVSPTTGGSSIDTSGKLTVAADETATTLTVTATSKLDATKSGSAAVTVTTDAPAPVYKIVAVPATVDFGTLKTGYTQPDARTVTITNEGNRTITLDQPGSGTDFTVTGLSNTTLPAGGTVTFTVRPNAALGVGTYSETIEITGANGTSCTVTASFKVNDVQGNFFELKVVGSYAAESGAGSHRESSTVTIQAGSRPGYTFTGWTDDYGVSFNEPSNPTTTFTMPALNPGQALTVTANWRYDGGSGDGSSGGGGGSSGGGSITVTTPPSTAEKPNPPATAESKVEAKVDGNGNATVSVPEKSVTDAIKAAQDAAKKAGTTENGIAVTISVETSKAAASIAATLPQSAVDALVKAGATELKIESKTADITLDLATMKQIQAVGGGNVTVSATKVEVSGLSKAAQAAVGNRPVFELSIQSGGKAVTNFGNGSVSVALPYTLQAGEKAGNLYGVYVDGADKVTYLTNSSYDANTKTLVFATDHFSTFGIGYKADTPAFTDTTGHWAKDDIDFVVSRGLLNGTGATTFSPNSSMTRGMFVTALGRLAGIDASAYKTGKFTDVSANSYYAPYVNWAAEKGIVSGTTATTFAPDNLVTRQQMATIMVNYAKAMGYTVPKTREAVTFADNSSIASWAADAVRVMQMAGVINGKDGNRFDPTGTATRAEVAAVFHRYVELVIDPATASGWGQNDSGHWLYYKGGKALTGWQTIGKLRYYFNGDGVMHESWKQDKTSGKWYYWTNAGAVTGWKEIDGKWYYFTEDGSMAVNTKIDGYEVGSDGVWKS